MYVYIYFINIYKKYIQNILYLTAMSGGDDDSDEEEEAMSGGDAEEKEEASYVAANKEIAGGIDRVTCMYIFCLT